MDDNTDKSLADGVNVAPSDGGAAVSEQVVSVKELLGKELGKDFPTDEAALKAVKDTFSYVGEYGKVRPVLKQLQDKFGNDYLNKLMESSNQPEPQAQPQAQPVDTSRFVTKDELEKVTFYSERKDLEPHKALLEALVTSTGKTRTEAAEFPEFKDVVTKAKAYDEVEKTKSVLQTSSRLGVATDSITKAKDALAKNDFAGAEASALQGVLEAYPELQ